MIVLKIIGILLLVLLALLVLCILSMCVKVHIDFKGNQDVIALYVGYGFIRLKLLPRKKRPPKKKPPQKPKKPPKEKKPKKKIQLNWKALDLGDTICLVLDLLEQMKNQMWLDTIEADVMLATGDPEKTGLLLGRLSALVGTVHPFLRKTFNIKRLHLVLDGDFISDKTQWSAVIKFSFRPIRTLWVLLKNNKPLRATWKLLKTTEEETES